MLNFFKPTIYCRQTNLNYTQMSKSERPTFCSAVDMMNLWAYYFDWSFKLVEQHKALHFDLKRALYNTLIYMGTFRKIFQHNGVGTHGNKCSTDSTFANITSLEGQTLAGGG